MPLPSLQRRQLLALGAASAADVAELTTRARSRGVQIREEGGAVELDDPWGNLVRLSA